MRKKIVAANWKMNKTAGETAAFLETFLSAVGSDTGVEIVVLPPFTALARASELLADTQVVKLGAQNMHPEKSGAFTGEISAGMLRDLYVRYVTIGHSERRALFGETEEFINTKVLAAHASGLRPILCVGETLEQRDSGDVESVLDYQLRGALQGLDEKQLAESVIAYEPVWAIGTGRNATPQQAQDAHEFIRKTVGEMFSQTAADKIRIQYGGSVKPTNATELMAQPDIDGALVGGASLDPNDFLRIVQAARGEES